MIVSFYDKNLELITVISRWVSLLGVNTYNSMGAFTLEMRSNSNISQLMKDFFYCTIDNDDENRKRCFYGISLHLPQLKESKRQSNKQQKR